MLFHTRYLQLKKKNIKTESSLIYHLAAASIKTENITCQIKEFLLNFTGIFTKTLFPPLLKTFLGRPVGLGFSAFEIKSYLIAQNDLQSHNLFTSASLPNAGLPGLHHKPAS